MDKITTYFQEAYDELVNKVTWPTWAELQESAVIVLVTAVLISLGVWFIDFTLRMGTTYLYKMIIG